MKSKLIGSLFLILSIIFLAFWSNVNNKNNQLDKKISSLKQETLILKEINDVLLLEYAAYSNPKNIEKMSLIYLENNNYDFSEISILEENFFFR